MKDIYLCKNCVYPNNAKPTIQFDENQICSGCQFQIKRNDIIEKNKKKRVKLFEKIILDAKKYAKKNGNSHDCIVPISGGKDSHYQVWLLKTFYDMKPLLVHYDHLFNAHSGVANLNNLVKKSKSDLITYRSGIDSVRKISNAMLKKVGDLTWHYHAGIRTFPFQIACKYNIPYIFLGEHGFGELTGLISPNYIVEHTYWSRKEHDMRGLDVSDLMKIKGIRKSDLTPFIYPEESEIKKKNVRGIYMSNFFSWNYMENTKKMIKEWGFKTVTYKRDRTFNLFAKIDDHANDVHDYLKYLKFGYGRGTDDASMEIRMGRLKRKTALNLINYYDKKTPTSLKFYCEFLGISLNKFYDIAKNLSEDHKRKCKIKSIDKKIIKNEIKLNKKSIFLTKNRNFYFNDFLKPQKYKDINFDTKYDHFYGY